MKKLLILVCTLALAHGRVRRPAKGAAEGHFTGTIEKYDAATKTLTLKHDRTRKARS